MHLDKQAQLVTASKQTEKMENIQTDQLHNGINGYALNGTDDQDPPAEVTGIISDPEEDLPASENEPFDENRQVDEQVSFDTAVVNESSNMENFETTEVENGLEGANSEAELPPPPPEMTGFIKDPEEELPSTADSPDVHGTEDDIGSDESPESRLDGIQQELQEDPEPETPPSEYIIDEPDAQSETFSEQRADDPEISDNLADSTPYAAETGFENPVEPNDPEDPVVTGVVEENALDPNDPEDPVVTGVVEENALDLNDPEDPVITGVVEEGSFDDEVSTDQRRNSIPIEVVAVESDTADQNHAHEVMESTSEQPTPTSTQEQAYEQLNAKHELDYDNNQITGYINDVDQDTEGATSQSNVQWQMSEYEQSPKGGDDMQLPGNGVLQSMSDPAPRSERRAYIDPEDPEFWFKAKSPISMDCYFAFACLSCIANFVIGPIALYLVQKGRDSSTANDARRYGCYSAGVGALGILVTIIIIVVLIVFA